jgi:predicted TIM-barrel fold metal-dependent hydrolase
MDLIADRGRRVSVEELNTTQLLRHARKQAVQRNLDDMLIVDVDAHHYENENYSEFLQYMENDVLKQLALSGRTKNRQGLMPSQVGYQDMGGRVTRYPMRYSEKTEGGTLRDIQLGHRWMDAMSVDYSCLFPTGMLNIGLHPQKEMEHELCWSYNRWLTEKVLPESNGRFYSMLSLPFNDPDEALRQVETFGDRKHVGGFMVTTVRSHMAVNDNAYMKVYRAIEERGLVLSFHSGPNWGEPIFKSCNRFLSVHALGFTWYNVLHLTNWVINGMGERFPKLPVVWIESGLDAAARPRIHAAALRVPAPQEEAVGLYARHVLLVAADGDPGHGRVGVHVPHDQCGNAAPLLFGLSALGLRPALDHLRSPVRVGERQAQYPGRHRGAPVQAAAAQRGAEGEPPEVRQSHDRCVEQSNNKASKQEPPPGPTGRRFSFRRMHHNRAGTLTRTPSMRCFERKRAGAGYAHRQA